MREGGSHPVLLRLKRALKWSFVLIVTALVLLFTVGNYEPVAVSLFPLPYEIETPKFLLVLVCFSLGVLVGGCLGSLKGLKWRSIARKRGKRADALENELNVLKMPPPSTTALPRAAQR